MDVSHHCPSCFAVFAVTMSTEVKGLKVNVFVCPLCRQYGKMTIADSQGLLSSNIRKLHHFGGY